MKYKICTYPECEHQGKPQPIENFYDSNRGKYGKDQYCKKCKIKYKNERKNLQRQLNTLKFEDIKQFTSTVACLYINRKDINQIITLCQITKDQLKKILIYEELFEYRICKKCFQLKHFDEYYRKPDKGLSSYCKECTNAGEESRVRHKKNLNSLTNYSQYIEDNLGYADIIRNNNGLLEVRCSYCGEWFKPIRKYVYIRIQALEGKIEGNGENRLYCSEQCKQECPIFNKHVSQLIKEDMVRAGRITPQELNREVQPELRQMVFERDNYTCQKCGVHKNDLSCGLNCHHIEGIRWSPLESADVNQCITVCVECHKKIHQIPGCGYYEMKCNTEDMLEV